MIRILHILGSMNRGGAETFIMNIYRSIDRNKIQFDFLLHTDEDCAYSKEINELGGRIYNISPRNKGVFKNIKQLNCFFKDHKEYKIAHQHLSSLSYLTPLIIAYKFNVPVRIAHSHSTREGGSKFHYILNCINKRKLSKISTKVFACSDNAAKWILDNKQYSKKNYRVIKNGIPLELFRFDNSERNRIRNEFKIQNKFVIGHIGNFVYPKNHEFLIDIFMSVREYEKNAVLLLIGDGQLKINIQEKINKLGITDRVIITGSRSDIPGLLSAIDVFVFPSKYEGLPVTLIEAQSSGLPCIVSDSITDEINLSEETYFLSLNDDVNKWCELILSYKNFKRSSPNKSEKMESYDIKYVSTELTKIYEGYNNG